MTLKEIVTTTASCIIIAVTAVLLIQASEAFDGISKTVQGTQVTMDGVNNQRQDIYRILGNLGAASAHLPGGS